MIIRWLYDDLLRDRLDDPVVTSFAIELLRAHRSGNHLAVIERKLAQALRAGADINDRDRALLDRLTSEYSQTGNLHRKASVYIDVLPESNEDIHVMGSAIRVPINKLLASRALERPILLSENIDNDGWIYKYILTNLIDVFSCPNVDLELSHGGGEDTVSVFTHHAREARIVCTIIDSDRKSPHSPDSEKHNRLRTRDREVGWPLSFVHAVPCHETENLLPHDLVATLPSGIVNSANQTILSISQAEINSGCDAASYYWLYFDCKNGIKSSDEENIRSEDWNWIAEKIGMSGINGKPWEISGFGDKLIQQVKSSNASIAEFRRLIRENRWLSSFAHFFSDVIWIFAASRALRT